MTTACPPTRPRACCRWRRAGLRVADASAMPAIVPANTNAAASVLEERRVAAA